MTQLLALAIALVAGLLMSRLTKLWNLPAVTAYLVAGVLIGPFCLGRFGVEGLGFISSEDVNKYDIICDVALGFIAFSMGSEFRVSELKQMGKKVVVVGILQAVAACVLVDIALIVLHFILGEEKLPMATCITLGAIATATAPASTLMVVKQYKAEGPVTKMLLPVVALDDVVGLIIFAISFGIAGAVQNGHIDIVTVVVNPIIEIVGSLTLGAGLGFLFSFLEQFFHSRSKRMTITVCFIFLAVGLSQLEFDIGSVSIGFSPLLVAMMLGTVFCNLNKFSDELMDRLDRWSGPIMVLFFVLSGAGLDLAIFTDWQTVVIGLVFIVVRAIGKIEGAKYSAKLMKCEPTIQKYLGITLLPQEGVCLGMSLMALALGAPGLIVRNIALFAVLVYEMVAPLLTKIALDKAGEIKEKPVPPRMKAKLEEKESKA